MPERVIPIKGYIMHNIMSLLPAGLVALITAFQHFEITVTIKPSRK